MDKSTKAKRTSSGKRLRFEIFKRDAFTCQYCGAQPPDVVLVVDHITPVAAGGSNDPLNLITACQACNQGKADRVLTESIVRPDADLMYLETQQEIAEVNRYNEALAQKREAELRLISSLQDVWCDESSLDWSPAEKVIRNLLKKYGPEITENSLREVAYKVGGGYITDRGDVWVKYLYAVARNMEAEVLD